MFFTSLLRLFPGVPSSTCLLYQLNCASCATLARLLNTIVSWPSRLASLPNIAQDIIISWVSLFVQLLLRLWSTLSFKVPCLGWPSKRKHQNCSTNSSNSISTYWPSFLMSPPSSGGISRLSPAPDAAEPDTAVLPGNFDVADSSIPDSVAGMMIQHNIRSCQFVSYLMRCLRHHVWLDES